MKTIILLLLISTCASAQVVTTQEEYNYLTKGYPAQLKVGGDMKKGYRFGESIKLETKYHTFDYKPLIKEETNEVVAISLVVKGDRKAFNYEYFMCIPINNEELNELFVKEINKKWDYTVCRDYAEVASKAFGKILQEKSPSH